MIKKNIALLSVIIAGFSTIAIAQVGFEVIPETESSASAVGAVVDNIREGGSVWKKYKDTAYGPENIVDGKRVRVGGSLKIGEQFATGVMTWDTILDYAVYLVKFVGQLALLVGALMIIYYGYKKATEHLKFNSTIGKVVTGILVISFAYVIVRIIRSMFIS
ncbi:MAG TPA: hypothetical protein PK674_01160 [Candidatus Absconditabacterales bacterium]|nr:hypothetical protein [Candidatus Absconditabacterales bacterium]HOQ78850.1 hypothetical protein [Candidatus Absconditabacterales bacterium]HPK27984.1 hypothetical protein [Candidatus Absconditabacterales bacterium]